MTLSLNDYQTRATRLAIYPGQRTPLGLSYAALKLAGEAGEVTENIGKAIRDDGYMTTTQQLTAPRTSAIVKELGDVLWYVAAIARELGYDLDTVAMVNLNKLNDRKTRGVLQGSGDDR